MAAAPTGKFMMWVTIEAKGSSEADKIISLLNTIAKRANSDEEPNCLAYQPGRSRDDPNTIIVFEAYDNKGSDIATKVHREGEVYQSLIGSAKELTNKIDMKFYDYV